MHGVRLLVFVVVLIGGVAVPPAAAQESVVVSTPYPGVAVEAGDSVGFDLLVTASSRERVALAVDALPDGWEAVLRGGGFTIDGVFAGPDEEAAPDVTLDVTVPQDAEQGVYDVAVVAEGASGSDRLVVSLRVAEAVAGAVSLTTDFPSLRGPADTDFSFDLTLQNDTPEELTFALDARGPEGWQMSARPSAEERAAAATVEGGDSARIAVEAIPPPDVTAGTYPLLVRATGGGRTVEAELEVEVTGTVAFELTTPDERLNVDVTAGRPREFVLIVANTGTSVLEQVELSASPPRDWEVEFAPAAVQGLPPGEQAEVTATITPAETAIAGDYVVTVTAAAPERNEEVEVRATVETSRAWGLVGIGLIAAALAGLGGVFRRYGRR
jgi:uncharacterized membrane protein